MLVTVVAAVALLCALVLLFNFEPCCGVSNLGSCFIYTLVLFLSLSF